MRRSTWRGRRASRCVGRLTLADVRLQQATEEQQDPQYVSPHGNSRSSSIDSVARRICKRRAKSQWTGRSSDNAGDARRHVCAIGFPSILRPAARAWEQSFLEDTSIYRIRGSSVFRGSVRCIWSREVIVSRGIFYRFSAERAPRFRVEIFREILLERTTSVTIWRRRFSTYSIVIVVVHSWISSRTDRSGASH